MAYNFTVYHNGTGKGCDSLSEAAASASSSGDAIYQQTDYTCDSESAVIKDGVDFTTNGHTLTALNGSKITVEGTGKFSADSYCGDLYVGSTERTTTLMTNGLNPLDTGNLLYLVDGADTITMGGNGFNLYKDEDNYMSIRNSQEEFNSWDSQGNLNHVGTDLVITSASKFGVYSITTNAESTTTVTETAELKTEEINVSGGTFSMTGGALKANSKIINTGIMNLSGVTATVGDSVKVYAGQTGYNGGKLNLTGSTISGNESNEFLVGFESENVYCAKGNDSSAVVNLTNSTVAFSTVTVKNGGTVNIIGSTFTATELNNNGTMNVSGNSKLAISELTGTAINAADGTALTDSSGVVKVAANGTLTVKGTSGCLAIESDANANTTLILQGKNDGNLENLSNVKWDLTAGVKDLSFDCSSSSISDTAFTIQGAAEGIANGDYTLATTAGGFSKTITVTGFTGEPTSISVDGGQVTAGDYKLSLTVVDGNNLVLTVAGPPSVNDETRMTALYSDGQYESGKTFKIGYTAGATSDYFKVANGTSQFTIADFQLDQALTDAGYTLTKVESTGDIFLKRANTKPTDIFFNSDWAGMTAGDEVGYTLKDGTQGKAVIGTTAFSSIADAFSIAGKISGTNWGYYSPFDKVTLHLLSDASTATVLANMDYNVKLVNDSTKDTITITSTASNSALYFSSDDPDYCEYDWGEGVTIKAIGYVMTKGKINVDGVITTTGGWSSDTRTIMNVSENGAFRYSECAATFAAVVTVTGDGADYTTDPQFKGEAATAIGAEDTGYTAGITVTKYGYAQYAADVTLGNDAGNAGAGTPGTLTLSEHGRFKVSGNSGAESLNVGGTAAGATGTINMTTGSVLFVFGDLNVAKDTGTVSMDNSMLWHSMGALNNNGTITMANGSTMKVNDFNIGTTGSLTMDKDSKFTFSGTWSNNGEFEIDLTGMDTTKKVYALIDNTGTTDATYNVTLLNMASGYTDGKTLNGGFAVYDSTITVDSVLLTAAAHETGEAITVTVGETEKTYYYGINAIQASTITALPSGATEYVFEDGAVFNSASGISVSTDNTVFVGLGENGGSITATSGTALTIAAEINVTMKGVLTIPTVLAGDVTVITLAEGATLKGTAITTGDTAEVKLSNGVTLNDTTITVDNGIATTITINGAVTMEGTSMISVDAGSAGAIILWDFKDSSATKTDYSLNADYFTANTGSTDTQLYISLKGAAGAEQELGNYTLLTNVTDDPTNTWYFKINGVAKTIGDSVELRTLESGNKVKATLVWEDNAVKLSVAEWVARLVVNAGETKDVSNMTFSGLGGVLVGGALHNSGTVTGTGTSFLNNTGSDGGAVYNQGTMTLTDVTFSGNQANTNGTVNNKKNATMTLKNAAFTNNNANQIGGAIYNGGTMTIEDSTFTSNTATYGSTSHGGAIVSGTAAETAGTLTIKNTTFTNNSAKMAGGALAVFNKVDLTDVTFSGNSSKLGGAIVMNSTGKLTLDNVTFNGNTISGSGAAGGAIYTRGATITLNGDVYLTTDTDTIVFSGSDELVWNITTDKYGFIDHYSQITFSSNTKRVITVGSDVSAGSYTLAGDASSAASQTFTVRSGESSGSVTVGGDSVTVGDYLYKLEVDSSDQLMLSVKATISEKMVTVSGSYMYNGTAQEANVTVKRGETTLVEGQDYTISFKDNTDAGTASFTITGMGSYEGTYNGTYEIAKRDVTLTSNSVSKMYDGTAIADSEVTTGGSGFVGSEVTGVAATGTITDAGTTANTIEITTGSGYKAENYDITKTEGTLTVTQRDVTITSGSAEKFYDGTPLTNDTVTVTGSGWADGEGAAYNVTGSQTAIGKSKNTFSYKLNDNTKADNYNITTVEGDLVVKSLVPITITADSASKMYDGTSLTCSGYTYTEDALLSGDVLTATVEGVITDAGTAANKVTSYKVMRGTEDVTAGYIFNDSVDGTLEITKRDVTITSGSDEKTYDGTPLTNDTVTVSGSGWADGEGATYTVTGSQTEIGSSANTFSYTLNDNTKADNYDITTVEGTLTVTPPVRISGISNYNNTAKSDIVQMQDGLVHVMYDTASGYVQSTVLNDIDSWTVTEFRRDLTGDGLADVQITKDAGDGTTWVAALRNDYLENGCITLNYQFIGAYNNELWSYLGSADTNGDGKAEVLMMQTDAGADVNGHRNVAAWVTDGEGKWVDNEWVGALSEDWSDVAGTADIDGNGTDNVILRRADGMIGYWSEAGTGDVVRIAESGQSVLISSGDFDGDKTDDLLFTNASGDFFTWSNIGGDLSNVRIGNLSDLGEGWSFAGTGDYNGDGMDELLWCDGTNTAYSEADKDNFSKLVQIA